MKRSCIRRTGASLVRRRSSIGALCVAVELLTSVWPETARADDLFEIEVFHVRVNEPLQLGAELHSNYVASGRTRDAPEVSPDHVLYEMLEPTLGLTKYWEVGAHLQAAVRPSGTDWGGVKLRTMFVIPTPEGSAFKLGVNVEGGYTPPPYDPGTGTFEIRPIAEWRIADVGSPRRATRSRSRRSSAISSRRRQRSSCPWNRRCKVGHTMAMPSASSLGKRLRSYVQRSAWALRPGKRPGAAGGEAAFCPDGFDSTNRDETADATDLDQIRACAQHVGALQRRDVGWFSRLMGERLHTSRGRRTSWTSEGPSFDADACAEAQIARASRKAALAGGLSSTGGQVGELAIVLTEGLAAPLGLPAALASVAFETVYSAVVQIDLVCDLASIYGVPFDTRDIGEVAAVFDLVLRSGSGVTPSRSGADRVLAPDDTELLARIGRALLEDGLLGLVPLVGIPCTAARTYRATRSLGESARDYARKRLAVRETLGAALAAAHFDTTLLLEGAWLLATADGVLTHEELLLLSTIARSIPEHRRPPIERLRHVGEGVWIARMARLDGYERDAILAGLHLVAGLRGATGVPERRFLEHAGEAIGQTIDFARIAHVRRQVDHGSAPSLDSDDADAAQEAARAARKSPVD
jgi:hypothetical protein